MQVIRKTFCRYTKVSFPKIYLYMHKELFTVFVVWYLSASERRNAGTAGCSLYLFFPCAIGIPDLFAVTRMKRSVFLLRYTYVVLQTSRLRQTARQKCSFDVQAFSDLPGNNNIVSATYLYFQQKNFEHNKKN